MRVIAGYLGGRLFESPNGQRTHPMSEKIRGAIFNALGDIEGLTVLDAYAGTGALAIEAISRGAASAVTIESDAAAHRTVQANVEKLGISRQIETIRSNVHTWSQRYEARLFDIVFLDPPYDHVQPDVLADIVKHAKLEGIVVASLPPQTLFELPANSFKLLTNKVYGDATISIYRRTR